MDTNYLENNKLTLVGKVTGEKKFSHETYGEKFYVFNLSIPRLSGSTEIIPITISERLITDEMLSEGRKLLIKGQFRSYYSYENERNKLILTVFAKEVEEQEESDIVKKDEITNEVVLIGFVCRKPIYRQTPFGREITDLLLAVNREYNKSDYISTIAWGRNARFCQNLEVGVQVKIIGKVQAKQYEKRYEDGTSEMRVAYEVSICSLELINEDGTDKEEMENREVNEGILSEEKFNKEKGKNILLVNTDYICGKELEMLGLVKGSTTQTIFIEKYSYQSLKNLEDGELKVYTEMMNDARALATKRMVDEADDLEADAIVNIRYETAAIIQDVVELIAYGTAVKFVSN